LTVGDLTRRFVDRHSPIDTLSIGNRQSPIDNPCAFDRQSSLDNPIGNRQSAVGNGRH
jgi:hypothetical protein